MQTRWYDPEIGRFINLDQISYLDPETANGLNLYAYCLNNPVMGYDPTGTLWVLIALLIGALADAVVGATIASDDDATVGERIANAVVGGFVGVAAAGLAMAIGSAFWGLANFTATVKTVFSLSLAAYDFFGLVAASLTNVDFTMVEYGNGMFDVPTQEPYTTMPLASGHSKNKYFSIREMEGYDQISRGRFGCV